jgi:hypothetical protein
VTHQPVRASDSSLGWEEVSNRRVLEFPGGRTRELTGRIRTSVEEVRAQEASPTLQARFEEPADLSALTARVWRDFAGVHARGANGEPTTFAAKLQGDTTLTSDQKDRIVRCMARATHFFARAPLLAAGGGEVTEPSRKYQEINRLHTLGELDQVYEAGRALGLDGQGLEDALLASIFSDVDKAAGLPSLVTHHEAGAKAAAVFLSREFDLADPAQAERVARVSQFVKDHQLSPPKFFSQMLDFAIGGAAREQGVTLTPEDQQALTALKARIAEPLDPAHQTAAGDAVAFTPAMQRILGLVGVTEWSVGTCPEAFALMAGDSGINYASPDGVAKIVAIRGPGTFFRDKTAQDSVESVLGAAGSAGDARAVLPKELWELYDGNIARTRGAVAVASARVDAWLREQGKAPEATPYWRGTPLLYPEGPDAALPGSDPQQLAADFQFALDRLRPTFEQFLREEQARY